MKVIVEDYIRHHRELGFALNLAHDGEQEFFARWRLKKRSAFVADGGDENGSAMVWVAANIGHGVEAVGLSGSLRQPDLPLRDALVIR